jgi:hypothetical protein
MATFPATRQSIVFATVPVASRQQVASKQCKNPTKRAVVLWCSCLAHRKPFIDLI